MAIEAAVHVATSCSYEVQGNTVIGHFANSPRYVKWFGVHDDPFGLEGPSPTDNEIDTGISAVPFRVGDESIGESPGMAVACLCNAPDADVETTMAYVFPDEHYVIHACPRFWASPDIPTARDESSRVGTIIHEAVHFNDELWRGSGQAADMHGHYSGPNYADAVGIAASNRELAARNPNNYKFFVLNQNW